MRALKSLADERQTGLTLHHGSGPQARKDYQSRHGRTPTEYLESIGVLGPNVVLAHSLGLDDAEIECLARTKTAVAMCPITAAKGARGIPEHGRMPELLAKGIKVALGCDSPNNSNHLDIVRAMNMAAIQYKDARQDMRLIPAQAAAWSWTPIGSPSWTSRGSSRRCKRSARSSRPGRARPSRAPAGRSSEPRVSGSLH